MVKYECYRCGYNTSDKTKIRLHLNRKIICAPVISYINCIECKDYILNGISYKKYCEDNNYTKLPQNLHKNNTICHKNSTFWCNFCEREFSRKDSLVRHLKTCKEKKKDDSVRESMEELVKLLNEKDKQLKEELGKKDKQMQEKDKEHKKQIEELIKKAGIPTTNNITNNIQNNFKLLNYKETDTSHLTENDYVKCLEHYNFCVPHLIRKIHFNPKKPENHNIYISNLKNSYVMIYINNKWKVKNRDETISRMIDDKQIILEKKIQEWVESGVQYPKVMAKFSRYIEKREENDVINAIKEDIKLILYNNRNMIIESKKLLK